MKKVIVFTGSGVSAESGIKTFRDSGGLWEEYNISDVATPEAWQRNPALVLDFYNKRRKQVMEAQPNAAHLALKKLEEKFDVTIITQNIDDLHERAGSKNIVHLHGEIRKMRSSKYSELIYDVNGWEIQMGQTCEKGTQLRPHIVWFGEMVPEMERAAWITSTAEVFIVIGTSLEVYPAASLVDYAPLEAEKYFVDPHAKTISHHSNLSIIKEKAAEGVPKLVQKLLSQ